MATGASGAIAKEVSRAEHAPEYSRTSPRRARDLLRAGPETGPETGPEPSGERFHPYGSTASA